MRVEDSEREGFPITSLREMNILSAIDHPYIVGVKEIVVGTDLNSIFMVMEISNHDLCEPAAPAKSRIGVHVASTCACASFAESRCWRSRSSRFLWPKLRP